MFHDSDSILCLPIGGCGQFGANLTVYGHDGALIAFDCGIGFADEALPGVDILMPDISWLEEQKDALASLIITHAHEDHIGAVAWLWPRLGCPIYISEFAALVLERKMAERGYEERPEIHILDQKGPIGIGPFTLEYTPVTHSIPETFSFLIETPAGRVVHTGDWNLDPTPIIGKPTDMDVFRGWGDRGILAMVGDSTNAPVPGRSVSEAEVANGLETVFKSATGRIAVTIFSSNIARVISIVRAAQACDRHVGLIGRSLKNMVDIAKSTGVMDADMSFVSEEDLGHLPDDKIVMIVTGSQGEPRAALSKIAHGMSRDISLGQADMVIFSARSIPGNERGILDVQNALAASGVKVVDPVHCPHVIHVSGHPRQEEIKEILSAIRPQILIPVHGEYQMQSAHAKLAQEHIGAITKIPDNGTAMRLSNDAGIEVIDHLEIAPKAIDFNRIIDVSSAIIGQRRKLSFQGCILLTVVVDEETLELLDTQVTMLGLVEEGDHLIGQTIEAVERGFEKLDDRVKSNEGKLVETLRPIARRVVKQALGARPSTEIHISYV